MDGGGGWVLPAIMMLLFVVLAAAAVYLLLRNQSSTRPSLPAAGSPGSAREMLDRRLVSGEIGEEEYRRLRAALADATAPPAPSTSAPISPGAPQQ
jgi:uncharacterized membrane protein